MGIVTGVRFASKFIRTFEVPVWVLFACHAAIALGTLSRGWRTVRTMGGRLTRLKPRSGFCAEAGAAVSVLLSTYLGIPVSTTHAIAGVGSIQRIKAVRWGIATRNVGQCGRAEGHARLLQRTRIGRGQLGQPVALRGVDDFTLQSILHEPLCCLFELRNGTHFGVTAHPTAEWTGQQLREAFPWDSAPRLLLRDRDRIFGSDFTKQVEELGIEEVLGVPRAPQQRAYIERVIGTIRRECLNHLIVFDGASLLRYLKSFHETRTHLSLEKDTPSHRPVQEPASGGVVAIPQVAGLHHRYERRAA
jgi:hypothetical protein